MPERETAGTVNALGGEAHALTTRARGTANFVKVGRGRSQFLSASRQLSIRQVKLLEVCQADPAWAAGVVRGTSEEVRHSGAAVRIAPGLVASASTPVSSRFKARVASTRRTAGRAEVALDLVLRYRLMLGVCGRVRSHGGRE